MRSKTSTFVLMLGMLLAGVMMRPTYAHATIEVYEFDNLQQEAQFYALIEDLRCPTCQNQNLASSDAPIAQDLKQKTYQMVKDGRSDSEIRQFMFERYGYFISYRPPMRPSTWILWFFPPILLMLLVAGWFYRMHKKPSDVAAALSKIEQTALSQAQEERLRQLLAMHAPKTQAGMPSNPSDAFTSTGKVATKSDTEETS